MNNYTRIALVGTLGAIAGYAYYYFFGCTNGCPLQSEWYITTGYGAVVGITLGFPKKSKVKEDNEQKDNEKN